MDWRENAERLREVMKKNAERGLKEKVGDVPPELSVILENLPEDDPDFTWTVSFSDDRGLNPAFARALHDSSGDDMRPLIEYLLSDQALGAKERERLARRLPKGTQIGRPRNYQIRGAAELAWLFYRRLREINKAYGIKDHGHCDDMKCYAAKAMVEDWFGFDFENGRPRSKDGIESFAGQVREFMDKAKSRRGGGVEKALVSLPAPVWWPRQKNRQNS